MKTHHGIPLFQALLVALAATFVAATFAACSSPYTLTMNASRDLVDESAVTVRGTRGRVNYLMVLPPDADGGGGIFNLHMAQFEKEFIRNGLQVISPAITARDTSKNRNTLELALIMARKSNADAVLQVGTYRWEEAPTRFFVRTEPDRSYREVSRTEYLATSGARYAFTSHALTFIGKLIDVESGEILAVFDLQTAANWNLPGDYSASIEESTTTVGDREVILLTFSNESYSYRDRIWYEDATLRTHRKLIEKVAEIIRSSGASAAR